MIRLLILMALCFLSAIVIVNNVSVEYASETQICLDDFENEDGNEDHEDDETEDEEIHIEKQSHLHKATDQGNTQLTTFYYRFSLQSVHKKIPVPPPEFKI